jgi:hypothetical protein
MKPSSISKSQCARTRALACGGKTKYFFLSTKTRLRRVFGGFVLLNFWKRLTRLRRVRRLHLKLKKYTAATVRTDLFR